MKKEWNGSRVHESEFEEKHPQLKPSKHRGDAEALQNPRPDRTEPLVVPVGFPNPTPFTSVGMQPSSIRDDLIMRSTVGTVTVVIS